MNSMSPKLHMTEMHLMIMRENKLFTKNTKSLRFILCGGGLPLHQYPLIKANGIRYLQNFEQGQRI